MTSLGLSKQLALSPFQVGDAIFGMNRPQNQRKPSLGAHQDFAIAEAQAFFKLPPDLELKEATTMTLVAQTAIDGLFNCLEFGFPAADVGGVDPTGQAILIWGGSSAVGAAAICIAKAAGFGPIFTTASPKNHSALLDLGATQCFDYGRPLVAEEVRAAAKANGKILSVVFDAVVGGADPTAPSEQRLPFEKSTPAIARSCCSSSDISTLKLVAVLPVVEDPDFRHAACWRPYGNADFFGKPQDPELTPRVRRVMEWLVQNHRLSWHSLPTTVVRGTDEAIEAIEKSATGAFSFEKVIVEHPL